MISNLYWNSVSGNFEKLYIKNFFLKARWRESAGLPAYLAFLCAFEFLYLCGGARICLIAFLPVEI